jgi:hypothetical protein
MSTFSFLNCHQCGASVTSTTPRGDGLSSSKPIPWRNNARLKSGLFEGIT